MAGLPSVPDDYEEGGDRDENTDGSDPGDIQGADGVDELRHQGGEPQAIIHAEDGGRAIVGRVLQASRSVIGCRERNGEVSVEPAGAQAEMPCALARLRREP